MLWIRDSTEWHSKIMTGGNEYNLNEGSKGAARASHLPAESETQ